MCLSYHGENVNVGSKFLGERGDRGSGCGGGGGDVGGNREKCLKWAGGGPLRSLYKSYSKFGIGKGRNCS